MIRIVAAGYIALFATIIAFIIAETDKLAYADNLYYRYGSDVSASHIILTIFVGIAFILSVASCCLWIFISVYYL